MVPVRQLCAILGVSRSWYYAAQEATPEERHALMAGMPPPVRLLMRTYGAWAYARYVRKVRGA